jgi:hypothetical protein
MQQQHTLLFNRLRHHFLTAGTGALLVAARYSDNYVKSHTTKQNTQVKFLELPMGVRSF